MKNPAAVALGSASWKSRKKGKGKSKKEMSAIMRRLALNESGDAAEHRLVDDVLEFVEELNLPVDRPALEVRLRAADIDRMEGADLIAGEKLANALFELRPLALVADEARHRGDRRVVVRAAFVEIGGELYAAQLS